MNENKVALVAAYLAEVKPLIKHYNLKKDKRGFYSNEELIVMICEPGIIQAVSSIGKLFASHSNIGALINFGCAGGYDAVSSFCLIDSMSFFQERDFLPAPFRHKFKNYHLETKLEPYSDYKEGIVFDMEGWAIYQAALKYLEKDLLFFVKVISDNPDTLFNKNSIALIVEKNLENFKKLLKKNKKHYQAPRIRHNPLARTI